MSIKLSKFAPSFVQSNIIELVYENESAKIYSVKLPFRYFACITIKSSL